MLQNLLDATRRQDLDAVKEAIAQGASVNVSLNAFVHTPIIVVTEKDHPFIALSLLNVYSDVDAGHRHGWRDAIVHCFYERSP